MDETSRVYFVQFFYEIFRPKIQAKEFLLYDIVSIEGDLIALFKDS